MNTKADQYTGRLTPSEIAQGISCARRNAHRLLDDARLLFESARYPSASALAILSIEESGKCSILRALALAQDDREAARRWHEYRTHIRKNVLWTYALFDALLGIAPQETEAFLPPHVEHAQILEVVKQTTVYSDCKSGPRWVEPQAMVNSRAAEGILRTAQYLLETGDCTPLEIELFIKHVAPVWGRDVRWVTQACHTWVAELKERGVIEPDAGLFQFFFSTSRGTRT